MPEEPVKSEPQRLAESKVIPPPRTDIVYPEVAAIPHGQKSVVYMPKGPEVKLPISQDEVNPNGVKTVVNIPKE